MKIRLLFTLLLLSTIAFGQQTRVKVPGTKCTMIPPAGFTAVKNFSGFQDEGTGTTIMVNELPVPYLSIIEGFTADALRSKGMTLRDQQTIDFNNGKASLFYVEQYANSMKYLKQIIIFGDEKKTIMINGIYPKVSEFVAGIVKESLLSTLYNDTINDDPLEVAAFSVDANNTPFKHVKYMSGGLIYSIDGRIASIQPTLVISPSISKVTVTNRKDYAVKRFQTIPGVGNCEADEINEIKIDSLSGYEIIAVCKTENPELVYQVMLFNDEGDYYILIGLSSKDIKKQLVFFKQIAKTFKRK